MMAIATEPMASLQARGSNEPGVGDCAYILCHRLSRTAVSGQVFEDYPTTIRRPARQVENGHEACEDFGKRLRTLGIPESAFQNGAYATKKEMPTGVKTQDID